MNLSSRTLRGAAAALGVAVCASALTLAASRPAQTAGGPIPVTVAAAVPLRDADNAARQPFQASVVYVLGVGTNEGVVDTAGGYSDIAVPAGKRLVIQTVSTSVFNPVVGNVLQGTIQPTAGAVLGSYALPAVTANGTPFPGVTQSLTLYADPSTPITFSATRKSGFTSTIDRVTFQVSGYLVNVP